MRTFFKSVQHLEPAQIDQLIVLLKQAREILVPSAAPLSPEERQNRSVAEKREGYVRLIIRLAKNYSSELPVSYDLAETEKLLAAREDWKLLSLKAEELAELADDTEYSISVELMKNADRAAKALDAGRKINPALDRAMVEVDEYNKQFGVRKESSTETIPPPPTTDTPE